jgi:hypothetical protein
MTKSAKERRNVRHSMEKQVIDQLSQTRFGQFSRVGQVKAAARTILMALTSKSRKEFQ